MNRIASVKLSPTHWVIVAFAAALLSGFASLQKEAAARPFEPVQAMPHTASPITRIREATGQVYRLIVEVDGAVKGGTAFLVSGRRIVATNHHVVEKGTAFNLGFVDENHRVRRMPLRLVAIWRCWKPLMICRAKPCRSIRAIPIPLRIFSPSASPRRPIRRGRSPGPTGMTTHSSSRRSSKAMCPACCRTAGSQASSSIRRRSFPAIVAGRWSITTAR
jgi:hypothetical protein